MKRFKSIFVFVLCFALVCTVPVSSFGADSTDNSVSDGYRGLFASLGMELISTSVPVTRGQFVTALITLMDFGPYGTGRQTFEDVPPEKEALHSAVEHAVGIGAVSVGQYFYPDRAITYAEACKMTVEALGYGTDARYRGGYPVGYYAVASSVDLDDGIDINAQFTSDAMYILLGNAANTNVKTISSCKADGEFVTYTAAETKPLLEIYRDIVCAEGIITASDGSYLYDSSSILDSGKIIIGDSEYAVKKGVVCPLGFYARVYAQKSGSRYAVIYADISDNFVTRIGAGNIEEYDMRSVVYTDEEDRERKLKLSADYTVIFNGKALEDYDENDILIDDGYLEGIDNNGDGNADVLAVWDAVYLVVDYVNTYSNEYDYMFFDKNRENNVFIDYETNYRSNVDIASIAQGDVLEAYISKDENFVSLNLLSEKISGTVDGIGSNGELYVSGKKYIATDYFNKFYNGFASPGKTLTLCYDGFGKAVAVTTAGGGTMKLAYFDKMSDKKQGIDDSVKLKLFTEDGEVITPVLADKVILDGSSKNAVDVSELIASSVGELIKYQLNADGAVAKINTESENEGIYDAASDGADTLKRFRFAGDEADARVYYKIFGYFVPHFTINSSTKIFKIALSESTDEERYSLGTLSFLENDQRVPGNSIRPYNVAVSGMAGAILYQTSDAAATSLSITSSSALVAEMSDALDEDGNEVFKIKLYAGDKFNDYYIRKDAKFLLGTTFTEEGYPFRTGDLIRYAIDDKGLYMLTAMKDFDYATKTLLHNSGDNTELHYYYGQIFAEGGGSLAIKKADGTIVYLPASIGDVGIVEDGKVMTQPREKVTTYQQMGESCHKVLIRCRYSQPNQIYVFK